MRGRLGLRLAREVFLLLHWAVSDLGCPLNTLKDAKSAAG